MTHRHPTRAVASLAVALLLLAGCTDDSSDPGDDRASAAQVLHRLGEQPEAIDDDALDDLVAAGSADDAAAEFRSSYLAYVEHGVEETVRDADGEDWADTLDEIDELWVQPAAEVLGAVEAGCDESGGTCGDRLGQAAEELRDAVESGTYAAMPVKLLPPVLVEGGQRIPMSAWTNVQKDEWQRLRDTTLMPQTAGAVERAAYTRRQSTGA